MMNAMARTIALSDRNLVVNVCLRAVYAFVRAVTDDGIADFAYGAMTIAA